MKLVVYDQEGVMTVIDSHVERVLMEAIRNAGLNLTAQCGGCASCATCHVYVHEEWVEKLNPLGPVEDEMLDVAEDRKQNSRLSCQVDLSPELDGLTVTLAPSSGF